MKLIILAAGLGSRLNHLTRDRPKCKLKVKGRAIIEHQLDVAAAVGITDITVVAGYRAEQLRYPGVRMRLNDDYRNNNILLSLMYAADQLDDDVIVSYADILYENGAVESLLAAEGDFLAVCDADWRKAYVGRKDHPVAEAEKVALRDGLIVRIGKHLSEGETDGEFIGMVRLSKKGAMTLKTVFGEVSRLFAGRAFQKAKTLERAYLTDMLQELIDRGNEVRPVLIRGGWCEIDTVEDFLQAGGEMACDLRGGQNFRGILNDLKRRPEDAAAELGESRAVIDDIISGVQPLPPELVRKAAVVWPVSPRDFYLLEDDAPSGVCLFKAAQSERSRRVMSRAGKDYYEYRDTAMSSLAQFRPEWIKELCVVEDDGPENPAVQWNNGHFLHQFTYFIGPVNFYYRGPDGTKRVAVMNTGDSMYITPFVPHSFATRANGAGESGIILALTYGSRLGGETRQELSALGPGLTGTLALDLSSPERGFGSLLRFHREGMSLSRGELAKRVGAAPAMIDRWESGQARAGEADLRRLADGLRVNVRDLLPPDGLEEPVLVRYRRDSPRWPYPDEGRAYEMVELAPARSMPFSKGLEVGVNSGGAAEPDLQAGLHQYVYNVGATSVNLTWRLDGACHEEVVAPGDSFYMKPCVPHAYRGAGGRLLVFRIGGRLGGDGQIELSVVAAAGRDSLARVVGESTQWYDAKGRQDISRIAG